MKVSDLRPELQSLFRDGWGYFEENTKILFSTYFSFGLKKGEYKIIFNEPSGQVYFLGGSPISALGKEGLPATHSVTLRHNGALVKKQGTYTWKGAAKIAEEFKKEAVKREREGFIF